jgi:hypothetical protein
VQHTNGIELVEWQISEDSGYSNWRSYALDLFAGVSIYDSSNRTTWAHSGSLDQIAPPFKFGIGRFFGPLVICRMAAWRG